MTDEAYINLVCKLDEAIAEVDGSGFRQTPLSQVSGVVRQQEDADPVRLWVKNDSANVSGSHKARHLMGVMIYLKVLEELSLPLFDSLRGRSLAIASCGNAALGAAVVARAARWPLDVFIPVDASPAVVERLRTLDARVHICERKPSEAGDPCYTSFQAAVAAGSIPFSVQGNENGLVVEGGKTLAYEMIEQLGAEGVELSAFFIQVGGGALGSACVQGFREALAEGEFDVLPRIYAVQTEGAHPLVHAYRFFAAPWSGQIPADEDLAARNIYARKHRVQFMKPWEHEPKSVAHGILDDETYDWACLVDGMVRSGGHPVLANEGILRVSNRVARDLMDLKICHTGTAGLAGLMAMAEVGVKSLSGDIGVLFTGTDRDGL